MAFGKGKQPQSYGVPVRSATPQAPPAPRAPTPAPAYEYAATAPAAAPAPAPAWSAPAPAPAWSATAAAPAPAWSAPAPAPVGAPQGFYAPASTPAGAPSSFYAPTAVPPAGLAQFPGAPYAPNAAYPTAPYAPAAFPPYVAGRKSSGARNVAISVAVVVVILLLAAVAIPVFLAQRDAPTLPDTLAGRSRSTDPQVAEALGDMRDTNNRKMSGAVYLGENGLPEIVLLARRGGTDMPRQVRQLETEGMPIDRDSEQKFGGVTCYTATSDFMTLCLWSDGVSGIVVQYLNSDLEATADIARAAKSELN